MRWDFNFSSDHTDVRIHAIKTLTEGVWNDRIATNEINNILFLFFNFAFIPHRRSPILITILKVNLFKYWVLKCVVDGANSAPLLFHNRTQLPTCTTTIGRNINWSFDVLLADRMFQGFSSGTLTVPSCPSARPTPQTTFTNVSISPFLPNTRYVSRLDRPRS